MPVLTVAQTSALRRALGALNNMLPQLELLKALGEVSEYWAQTAATLYARYSLVCRLSETALAFDASSDQPRNTNQGNIGLKIHYDPGTGMPQRDGGPRPTGTYTTPYGTQTDYGQGGARGTENTYPFIPGSAPTQPPPPQV